MATRPLNFQNHCVFCLQLQPPGVILQVVEANSKNIKDFQPILNYLTGTDPTFDKGTEECLKRNIPVMGKFLPPMCQDCYDMIGGLHELHKLFLSVQCSIQNQVNLIRNKVMETEWLRTHNKTPSEPYYSIEESTRNIFNNRIATSGMNQSQIESVMEFMSRLHEAIIKPGSSQVIYPSKPPPAVEGGTNVTIMPISPSAPAPLPLLIAVPPVVAQINSTESDAISIAPAASTPPPIMPTMLQTTPRPHFQPGHPPQTEVRSFTSSHSLEKSAAESRTRRRKQKLPPGPPKSLPLSRPSEVILMLPDDSEIKYENENSDEDEAQNDFISAEMIDRDLKCSDPDPEIKSELEEEEKKPVETETRQNKRKQSFQTLREQLPTVKGMRRNQTCDLCGKRYRLEDIARHLKTHVKDYVTKCVNPSCPYRFSCRYKMEEHSKSRKRKKHPCRSNVELMKKCPVNSCSFETERMDNFQSHLDEHEKEIKVKAYSCPIPECAHVYGFRESVEIHLFFHNLRPPPPAKQHQECSICKAEVKPEEMEKHLMSNHRTEAISCKTCKLVFPSDRLALVKHLWDEHKDFKGISCDICEDGVKYSRWDIFCEHYSIAHNVGELPRFICDHCSVEFTTEPGLRFHIKQVHPNHADKLPPQKPKKKSKRICKCELCPNLGLFRNMKALFLHKTQVHNSGVKHFSCKHCEMSFNWSSLLRNHLAKFHGGVARTSVPMKCSKPGCEKLSFKDRERLQYHLKTAHAEPGNEKPFQCEKCEKRYWTQKDLDRHQQFTHEGIRPYMCDTCGEGFTCTSSLRRHNLIHTGEMPYQCPICNQPFRHRETLNTHVRGHQEKGDNFRPSGPAKKMRKRVDRSLRKD